MVDAYDRFILLHFEYDALFRGLHKEKGAFVAKADRYIAYGYVAAFGRNGNSGGGQG